MRRHLISNNNQQKEEKEEYVSPSNYLSCVCVGTSLSTVGMKTINSKHVDGRKMLLNVIMEYVF